MSPLVAQTLTCEMSAPHRWFTAQVQGRVHCWGTWDQRKSQIHAFCLFILYHLWKFTMGKQFFRKIDAELTLRWRAV